MLSEFPAGSGCRSLSGIVSHTCDRGRRRVGGTEGSASRTRGGSPKFGICRWMRSRMTMTASGAAPGKATSRNTRPRRHGSESIGRDYFRSQGARQIARYLAGREGSALILNQGCGSVRSVRTPIKLALAESDYQLYHELVEAGALARTDELFFASAEPGSGMRLSTFSACSRSSRTASARLLDTIGTTWRCWSRTAARPAWTGIPESSAVARISPITSFYRHSGQLPPGLSALPVTVPEPSIGLVPIDEAFSKLSGNASGTVHHRP